MEYNNGSSGSGRSSFEVRIDGLSRLAPSVAVCKGMAKRSPVTVRYRSQRKTAREEHCDINFTNFIEECGYKDRYRAPSKIKSKRLLMVIFILVILIVGTTLILREAFFEDGEIRNNATNKRNLFPKIF